MRRRQTRCGATATWRWETGHGFAYDGDPFFEEIREIDDEIGEALPRGSVLPRPQELADNHAEIEASGSFEIVTSRRYSTEPISRAKATASVDAAPSCRDRPPDITSELLGLDDEVGSIGTAKRADLVMTAAMGWRRRISRSASSRCTSGCAGRRSRPGWRRVIVDALVHLVTQRSERGPRDVSELFPTEAEASAPPAMFIEAGSHDAASPVGQASAAARRAMAASQLRRISPLGMRMTDQ